MPIELVFKFADEVVTVKIIYHDILFYNSMTNFTIPARIEGIKLNIAGILKEFPDLKGKPEAEIKQEAIRRFKEKVKTMKNENEIKDYIIEEFTKKLGYTLMLIKKEGFRAKKF